MTEDEWFEGYGVSPMRKTIAPYWVLVLVAVLMLVPVWAFAEPIGQAKAGNVTITVYNEKCTHQDAITNLPMRATWEENGKVFDGCVGAIPQLGVAMFWFTDKTMAVVPIEMFAKVTGV